MSTWREDLIRAAAALGVELTDQAMRFFEIYLNEITSANEKVNLVSVSSDSELAVRHFADSLACIKVLPPETASCIDIGSGAGLPGIPLKIVRPAVRMVLLESVRKKAEFLRNVAGTLGMSDIEVLSERAETIGQDPAHREKYDAALSRATAPFPVAAEYTLPLVRIGGCAIIYQGTGVCEDSLESSRNALDILGGTLANVEPYRLEPDGTERTIVRIEKTAPSAPEHPRRPGVPKKRPLTKKGERTSWA